MKPTPKLLLAALAVLAGYALGQTIPNSAISPSNAVRIVRDHLALGMTQPQVRSILKTNGFPDVGYAAVVSHACFRQQDALAGGYALLLDYMPTLPWTNGMSTRLQLTTSRLRETKLLSNGISLFTIPLTNAP